MIKKIFNSTNIFIIVTFLLLSIGLAIGIPYAWNKIRLIEDPIFTWGRLLIGIIIWGISSPCMLLYMHIKRPRGRNMKLASSKYMDDKEYKKLTRSYDFDSNEIEDGFVLSTSLTKKNTKLEVSLIDKIGHAMVLGSTNSGKTALVVDPQIRVIGKSVAKASMFVADPKGELFDKHSGWLEKQGYEVLSINLRDETVSSYWNPLEKIWDQWKFGKEYEREDAKSDLSELSSALFPNTGGKDSFFEGGANTVFQFFALALLELSDEDDSITLEHFNITNIVNNIQQTTDEELEVLVHKLPKNSSAMQVGGRNIRGEAKQTLQNLFQNVITSLKIYSDPIIKKVTSKTTVKIDNNKPQAIFIIVPDETKAKYPFISLFVSQTYRELIETASKKPRGKLSRPIYYILDEFGNLPKIPSMDSMLTVSRSRNIFFMLLIQSYSQLRTSYGSDVATTLVANSAIEYFILSNDYNTAKLFSDKLGDAALMTSSKSSSSNLKGISSSTNESERTRRLIHADELMKLEFGEMVIKVQRKNPIKVHTSKFYEFKGFEHDKLEVTPHNKEFSYDKKHLKLLVEHEEDGEEEVIDDDWTEIIPDGLLGEK